MTLTAKGIFSLSVWLPTYITQVLGLSLTSSALLALIPPLGGIAAGSAAASTIDVLTSRRHGWSLTAARRAAQVGCFVLPSACFLGAVLSSGWTSLCLIMLGQSFHGFAMVGIWSSHADISPQYGGFLASATSSCASAAGAASVSAVGGLYQATGSWNIALVGPLVALYLVGAWVWTTMVVNEPQDFSTGGAAPATA